MNYLIVLTVLFSCLFIAYRSCTVGYDRYGYFVRVSDETVFNTVLSGEDSRLVEHGRILMPDIIAKDDTIDQGDGPDSGHLRWYQCSGIDCDEGWQRSFLGED